MSLFRWSDAPPEPGASDERILYHFRSRDSVGAVEHTFEAATDAEALEHVRLKFRTDREGREYRLVRVTTLRETLPLEETA
jgi:hypothetical protein